MRDFFKLVSSIRVLDERCESYVTRYIYYQTNLVRMVLKCKLSVGLLKLGLRGSRCNAQNVVVLGFSYHLDLSRLNEEKKRGEPKKNIKNFVFKQPGAFDWPNYKKLIISFRYRDICIETVYCICIKYRRSGWWSIQYFETKKKKKACVDSRNPRNLR